MAYGVLAAGGSLSVVSREGSVRPDAMAITSFENGICRTDGLRKNFVHGAKLLRWMRQRGRVRSRLIEMRGNGMGCLGAELKMGYVSHLKRKKNGEDMAAEMPKRGARKRDSRPKKMQRCARRGRTAMIGR